MPYSVVETLLVLPDFVAGPGTERLSGHGAFGVKHLSLLSKKFFNRPSAFFYIYLASYS